MPLAAAAATHPETPPLLPARESSFLLLSGRYGQQVAPVGNLDRGGKVPRALGLQSCPGAPGAECRPLGGLAGVARPFPRETVPPGRPRQLKSQIHLLSTPAYGVSLLCEPVKSSLSALPGLTRSDQPQERRTPSGVRPRALGSRDPQGLPEVLRVGCRFKEVLRQASSRRRGASEDGRGQVGPVGTWRPDLPHARDGASGPGQVCASESVWPRQGPREVRLERRGGRWQKALEGNKEQSQSFDPRCDRSAVLHAPAGNCVNAAKASRRTKAENR